MHLCSCPIVPPTRKLVNKNDDICLSLFLHISSVDKKSPNFFVLKIRPHRSGSPKNWTLGKMLSQMLQSFQGIQTLSSILIRAVGCLQIEDKEQLEEDSLQQEEGGQAQLLILGLHPVVDLLLFEVPKDYPTISASVQRHVSN